MQMKITFPGGSRVDVAFGPYVVHTDQPSQDGAEGSAPSPFALFLASLGSCAGYYVLRFLQQRQLPTDEVRLTERVHSNPATGMTDRIELEFSLPEDFPEKYLPALIRAAEKCAVNKHLALPPAIVITALPDRAIAG